MKKIITIISFIGSIMSFVVICRLKKKVFWNKKYIDYLWDEIRELNKDDIWRDERYFDVEERLAKIDEKIYGYDRDVVCGKVTWLDQIEDEIEGVKEDIQTIKQFMQLGN